MLAMSATLSSETRFCLRVVSEFGDPLERNELTVVSLRAPRPPSHLPECLSGINM